MSLLSRLPREHLKKLYRAAVNTWFDKRERTGMLIKHPGGIYELFSMGTIYTCETPMSKLSKVPDEVLFESEWVMEWHTHEKCVLPSGQDIYVDSCFVRMVSDEGIKPSFVVLASNNGFSVYAIEYAPTRAVYEVSYDVVPYYECMLEFFGGAGVKIRGALDFLSRRFIVYKWRLVRDRLIEVTVEDLERAFREACRL